MKKNNRVLNPGEKLEKILGMALQQNSRHLKKGVCLSPEEIGQLIEKKISGKERNRLLNHLSRCEDCYQTFMLSSELVEKPEKIKPVKERPLRFRTLALAASAIIVVISLFILYKTGTLPRAEKLEKVVSKTDLKDTPKKALVLESLEEEKTSPSPSQKQSFDELKILPEDRTGKSPVPEPEKQRLPGTQRELEIPYPPEPKTDKKMAPATGVQVAEEKGEEQYLKEKEKKEAKSLEASNAVDGIMESEVAGRHHNGQVQFLNTYKMAQNQRVLVKIMEYDHSGRVISIMEVPANIQQKFGYYPDGNKKFQEEYQNAKPHGIWIWWNQKGEVVRKIIYIEGKPQDKHSH